MTMMSVNKLKKQGFIWDMNQNVLIQKTNDKKVCDIEKHYELLTIEFNPVPPINKKTIVKQEDVVPIINQKEKNVNSIAVKEDVVLINQKEKNSVMKTPHNGSFAASGGEDDVPVPVNFDKKNPTLNKVSMNSKNSKPDWSKDASDNIEMMDQKAHLMKTANGPKKRRFRCKKRCKKRRSKTRKSGHSASKKLVFGPNANVAS